MNIHEDSEFFPLSGSAGLLKAPLSRCACETARARVLFPPPALLFLRFAPPQTSPTVTEQIRRDQPDRSITAAFDYCRGSRAPAEAAPGKGGHESVRRGDPCLPETDDGDGDGAPPHTRAPPLIRARLEDAAWLRCSTRDSDRDEPGITKRPRDDKSDKRRPKRNAGVGSEVTAGPNFTANFLQLLKFEINKS